MQLPWIDEDALAVEHPRIYHYTIASRLEPILASGGLLATHYDQTNDRDEMRALRDTLVIRMAEVALERTRARLSRGDIHVDLPEEQFEAIIGGDAHTFFDIMVRVMPSAPHITCFSAHDRPHHQENGLLTMWRLYGGEGQGVALGFDTAKLVAATYRIRDSLAIDTIYLDRVGYGEDDPEIRRRLDDSPEIPALFSTFLIALMEGRTEIPETELGDLFKFLTLCASVKRADFEDEREIRLITAQALPHTVNGRDSPSLTGSRILLPFLEALDEVLIGPSNVQEALYQRTQHALAHADMKHVGVRKSHTSFRVL